MTDQRVPAWVPPAVHKTLRLQPPDEERTRKWLANYFTVIAVGRVDRRCYYDVYGVARQIWALPVRDSHMGNGTLVLTFEASGRPAQVSDFEWAALVPGDVPLPPTVGIDEFMDLEFLVDEEGFRLFARGSGRFAALIWAAKRPSPPEGPARARRHRGP